VRSGTVDLFLPTVGQSHIHLATFTAGSFFGELSFLDHLPKDADAVARHQAELFVLTRERINELSREFPQVGAVLFARIAKELAYLQRRSSAALRALGS